MNLNLTLSAPLPWLTMFAGRLLGKRPGRKYTRKRGFLKLPRSLSFTRDGKRFIITLLLIGLAAINTGNNLLYLVVAMMLSLIIISGIMSESTVKNVRVERRLPRRIYCNTPVAAKVVVRNENRLIPSYSVRVEELANPGIESRAAYVLKLDPSEQSTQALRYCFKQRGMARLDGFNVTTRFPFGLIIKGRKEYSEVSVLVYPRLKRSSSARTLSALTSGTIGTQRKGPGTQIHNLRDYTLSDDSRLIHWKSSAKSQRIIAKEFEKESQGKFLIVFENHRLKDNDTQFEDLVEEAAGAADRLISRGATVGLKTLSTEIPATDNPGQLDAILKELALIEPVGPGSTAPSLKVVTI